MAPTPPPALQIRGKVHLQPDDPDQPPTLYVFQRVRPGLGNLRGNGTYNYQVRLHVIPTDRHTPAQLAQRAKITAAVQAWHALTPEQKEAWEPAGTKRKMSGYNAFLSDYMRPK